MHLIIMGAPGAGKGTYAEGISKYYGIPHISTGEIFRDAISKETPMGILAKMYIDKGQLVPDDVANAIVEERIKQEDCQKGFLFDGFPRTLNQAIEFEKVLEKIGKQLDAAINIDVPEEVIIERIVHRRICTKCGKSFNVVTLPPKQENICDDCGAELYQRDDDNYETIRKRLDVYYDLTMPLIDFYKSLNKLVNIDGVGKKEEVTKLIIDSLEAL
ncbi:MAG: adenylate kinase [Bacilli bacterium]|nr:adenylate kinase [Bacilli bacterium]MBQ9840696.1 adenylate kinase [Erysipelotrichaceae bacterium]